MTPPLKPPTAAEITDIEHDVMHARGEQKVRAAGFSAVQALKRAFAFEEDRSAREQPGKTVL